MIDKENLTLFPETVPYDLKQVSSYNPKTKEPGNYDWFANYDASYFIRVEENQGRREFVMMDEAGPGAIVRWWMTFWRAQNGTLRIYLDQDSVPELEGAPFDLISGQTLTDKPLSIGVPENGPQAEWGHNLYLPIPFAEHCKITYECDSLVVFEDKYFPDVFYNICFQSYEPGTVVKTFSKDDLASNQSLLARCNEWLSSPSLPGEKEIEFAQTLAPGDSLILPIRESGEAISWLQVKVEAEDQAQALRSTVLSATFDAQRTIWVPVGEFFGACYQILPHQTWMNQCDEDGTLTSSWLMPFRDSACITWINFGDQPVKIQGDIGLIDYKWKQNSLYFAACWHEYHHIRTRDTLNWFFDVNFVDIQGTGLYVGDQVTLYNMAETWWGEGDEKIFVDGEKFPSSIGTGSEDYYGYAFGHPEAFSHPFIAQPSGEGNFVPGMTVNMRHRSLDAIPFEQSLSSNIELWHWADCCINYATTAFYYVACPFKINISPDIRMVRRNVATSPEDFNSENDTLCRTIDQFSTEPPVIAMAQILCVDGESDDNRSRVGTAIIEAVEKGAQLVTFPETVLFGWVNPVAWEEAQPIPGRDSDFLCRLAKKYGVWLSIGLEEKEGDQLYDSALLIDDQGQIVLKHRKINVITELMDPPYTAGNQVQAVETPFGKVGMLICADTFKPEVLDQMKAIDPDLLLVPYGWAAPESDWPQHGQALENTVRHAAQTIGCTIVGTDLIGTMSQGPWKGFQYGGQSVAITATGQILAKGPDRLPQILLLEL